MTYISAKSLPSLRVGRDPSPPLQPRQLCASECWKKQRKSGMDNFFFGLMASKIGHFHVCLNFADNRSLIDNSKLRRLAKLICIDMEDYYFIIVTTSIVVIIGTNFMIFPSMLSVCIHLFNVNWILRRSTWKASVLSLLLLVLGNKQNGFYR